MAWAVYSCREHLYFLGVLGHRLDACASYMEPGLRRYFGNFHFFLVTGILWISSYFSLAFKDISGLFLTGFWITG